MEREWRCKECSTLLGVERDPKIFLRYKQVQYIIDGEDFNVIAVCRNCSTVNEKRGGRKVFQSIDSVSK